MSAHFLDRIPVGSALSHFNFIGDDREIQLQAIEAGFQRARLFRLGIRELRGWVARPLRARRMPLAHAILKPELWTIVSESFPAAEEHLRRLLIFLPKTEARYLTTFLDVEEEPAATVSVGVSGDIALVLTAAVRPRFRRMGLARDLVEAAAQSAIELGARQAIFWTDREFLLKFADRFTEYAIYRSRGQVARPTSGNIRSIDVITKYVSKSRTT